MKKLLLIGLLCILGLSVHAQIRFEKGYFINNENERKEVYIKNIGWGNNPTMFKYKFDVDGIPKTASVDDVSEFGFDNGAKYIRVSVEIDRSSDQLNELSYQRIPEFKKETLFLKVLIEGEATLCFYKDKTLERYFYSKKGSSSTQQLVYKRYRVEDKEIRTNNTYWGQLLADVSCKKKQNIIGYNRKALKKYFADYNNCKGGVTVKNCDLAYKSKFHLRLIAGVGYSSLSLSYPLGFSATGEKRFEDKYNFRFGIGAELILPFNKNKWGLFAEPVYQEYVAEDIIPNIDVTCEYRSVEFLVGVRHYSFLTKNSNFYLEGGYLIDFDLNSKIKLRHDYGYMNPYTNVLDVKSSGAIFFGVGYSYKRLAFGVKYIAKKSILDDYMKWSGIYNDFSVLMSYTIF